MDLLHQTQKLLHNFFLCFPFFTFKRKLITYPLPFLFLICTSILLYKFVTPPIFPQQQQQPQQYYSRLGFNVSDLLSRILPKNQTHSINNDNLINNNSGVCDYSNGQWVWDESYILRSYTEDCPFLDPGFRCRRSGRPDVDYLKWRWQPHDCDLPRFNATDFLERSRNGRIVFVGDSIGRNQWESLICMIAQGVSNISTIYEENGIPLTKHRGHLSIRFQQYNFTVEYDREPFLVTTSRLPKNAPKEVRGAISIDKLHWSSSRWIGADILVFNTGHWWNEDKTMKMGFYFQEGESLNMTMGVAAAFRRSIVTWKSWVIQKLNSEKSRIFFRSYSPVHYRDGTWNEGGHCDTNISPETNYTNLEPEPWNNLFVAKVIQQLENAKRNAFFLNVTYMTEFRKDSHPSRYREPGTPADAPQDCSHWCLPGVPDTWNELLYAHLLSKGFRTRPD